MHTQPCGVFRCKHSGMQHGSLQNWPGKAALAMTGLGAGCHNQALPCSEQDVSGNKTQEERTGGNYCSFSVDKHTLSQTSLLQQQHENTASHKEINAILLNSNL